jgi:hypothetical protein
MLSPPRTMGLDRRSVPWQVPDLLRLYLANISGMLLIVVAWFEASGAASQDAQILWLDVGIVGVIVAGAGNVLWLLTGRRAVGELRRALTPALMARFSQPTAQAGPAASAADPRQLVTGADMTRYHRADCLLVAGKELRAAPEETHRARGLRPCQVCRSAALEAQAVTPSHYGPSPKVLPDDGV